jgi:hypothetical protein
VWASGGNTLFHTSAIHGQSIAGNGVEGVSSRDIASGVYGQNNSTGYGVAGRANNGVGVLGDSSNTTGVLGTSPTGTGVAGTSPNGWAFKASGNAKQSVSGGGFVKAFAEIFPATGGIGNCFNSQVPASQATSGTCGISFEQVGAHLYSVDFGFNANNSDIQVTPEVFGGFAQAYPRTDGAAGVHVNNISGNTGDTFMIAIF